MSAVVSKTGEGCGCDDEANIGGAPGDGFYRQKSGFASYETDPEKLDKFKERLRTISNNDTTEGSGSSSTENMSPEAAKEKADKNLAEAEADATDFHAKVGSLHRQWDEKTQLAEKLLTQIEQFNVAKSSNSAGSPADQLLFTTKMITEIEGFLRHEGCLKERRLLDEANDQIETMQVRISALRTNTERELANGGLTASEIDNITMAFGRPSEKVILLEDANAALRTNCDAKVAELSAIVAHLREQIQSEDDSDDSDTTSVAGADDEDDEDDEEEKKTIKVFLDQLTLAIEVAADQAADDVTYTPKKEAAVIAANGKVDEFKSVFGFQNDKIFLNACYTVIQSIEDKYADGAGGVVSLTENKAATDEVVLSELVIDMMGEDTKDIETVMDAAKKTALKKAELLESAKEYDWVVLKDVSNVTLPMREYAQKLLYFMQKFQLRKGLTLLGPGTKLPDSSLDGYRYVLHEIINNIGVYGSDGSGALPSAPPAGMLGNNAGVGVGVGAPAAAGVGVSGFTRAAGATAAAAAGVLCGTVTDSTVTVNGHFDHILESVGYGTTTVRGSPVTEIKAVKEATGFFPLDQQSHQVTLASRESMAHLILDLARRMKYTFTTDSNGVVDGTEVAIQRAVSIDSYGKTDLSMHVKYTGGTGAHMFIFQKKAPTPEEEDFEKQLEGARDANQITAAIPVAYTNAHRNFELVSLLQKRGIIDIDGNPVGGFFFGQEDISPTRIRNQHKTAMQTLWAMVSCNAGMLSVRPEKNVNGKYLEYAQKSLTDMLKTTLVNSSVSGILSRRVDAIFTAASANHSSSTVDEKLFILDETIFRMGEGAAADAQRFLNALSAWLMTESELANIVSVSSICMQFQHVRRYVIAKLKEKKGESHPPVAQVLNPISAGPEPEPEADGPKPPRRSGSLLSSLMHIVDI